MMQTMTIHLDEQAVVDGYLSGKSLRDLAGEFDVSIQPIRRVLKKNDVSTRGKQRGPDRTDRLSRSTAMAPEEFSDEHRKNIVARFLSGETQVYLASEFMCGTSTIGRILRSEGIPAGAHGQLRDRHHAWRGGKTMRNGYIYIRPEAEDEIGQAMRGTSKYVLESRLVMAHALGRPLTSEEQVHHIDTNNKQDNRIENLQLRLGPHGKGSAFRCRSCGSHDIEAVELAVPEDSETVTL